VRDDIALSWPLARRIGRAGLAGHAAWVPIGRGERDPQQFWLSVPGAAPEGPGLGAGPAADGGAGHDVAVDLLNIGNGILAGGRVCRLLVQEGESGEAVVVVVEDAVTVVAP
jgi:hypothetical protein